MSEYWTPWQVMEYLERDESVLDFPLFHRVMIDGAIRFRPDEIKEHAWLFGKED